MANFNDDFSVSIKTLLDTSQVESDIAKLGKNAVLKIENIEPNTDGLIKKIQSALNNHKFELDIGGIQVGSIGNQIKSAGTAAGKTFSSAFNSGLKPIKLKTGMSDVTNMQKTLKSLRFDHSSIDLITRNLNELNLTAKKVTTSFRDNGDLRITVKGFDEIGRAVTVVKDFSAETKKISTVRKTFSQSFGEIEAAFNKVKTKISSKDFETEINSIGRAFDGLKDKPDGLTREIEELRTAYKKMTADGASMDEVMSAYEEYSNLLPRVTNQLEDQIAVQRQLEAEQKKFTAEAKEAAKAQDNLLRAKTLSNEMEAWLNTNTKAAERFGSEIRGLQQHLNEGISSGIVNDEALRDTRLRFGEIKSEAKAAGLTVKTFSTQLKDIAKDALGITSLYSALQMITRVLKEMYQAVYDIDTAMTEIKKVTDESPARYVTFLDSAADSALNLGRSISSVVEQTAAWAKLGYGISDAEELAKLSSIYSNVADVDDQTAVSDIVTAMKAFNIEASNAQTIIDSLNELGNRFATSAGDLGQGLSKSASTLNTAGTDMYKSLAMLTGITEITQNANESGNALKIFSMRIRGMKGELEELGEEVDDSVDSISKVQTQILNLTHGKVNIFDDTGEFRDYYEIMKDISEVIDDLTSTDRASLMEILFGKQRGNQGAAMIQAFQSGQIEKAYQTALGSDGSALAEQEKWMDSLEAKSEQLTAAWQGLSQAFLNDSALKVLISSGTSVLTVLTKIIETLGSFNTALVTVGIISLITNFD